MAKRVGQFQHSAGTRRIVVGSVMHLTNLPGRERMLLTKAKMVVVCSDNNVLVSKSGIGTGQQPNNVCDRPWIRSMSTVMAT